MPNPPATSSVAAALNAERLSSITLWSWNVNGLRSAIRRGLIDTLVEKSPDLICLQEIRARADLWDPLSESLGGYHVTQSAALKAGYSGVAIYSRVAPAKVVTDCFGDDRFRSEGRSILAVFEKFAVLNVYMPHGSRDQSRLPHKLQAYRDLTEFVETWAGPPLVVAGDFNIAHERIDLARPSNNLRNVMFTESEREAFGKLLAKGGLVDVFRRDHPESSTYSWWPYLAEARLRNVGWRIDYILVSKKALPWATQSSIQTNVPGSDHCPVSVTLQIKHGDGI